MQRDSAPKPRPAAVPSANTAGPERTTPEERRAKRRAEVRRALREALHSHDISLTDAASSCDVSRETVGDWTEDRVNAKHLGFAEATRLPESIRLALAALLVPGFVVVPLPAATTDALTLIDTALASMKEHTEATQCALAMRHRSALTASDTETAAKETAEAVVAVVQLHRAVTELHAQALRDRVVGAPRLAVAR